MRTGVMSGNHASDDRLEQYCLGRVPDEELEEIEEHLLVCPACQEHLRVTDRYIRTMRAAISSLAAAPARPERWWETRFAFLWKPLPAAALAGVAALLFVWAVVPSLRNAHEAAPVAVTLEALRGGGETLHMHAPEKTPLVLTLDLTGMAPLASYQVRIVDAAGAPVFESQARPETEHVIVHAPAGLQRGAYWVRLYDRADTNTPLREYGLELQ